MIVSKLSMVMRAMLMCLVLFSFNACAATRSPMTGMQAPSSATPLSQAYVWYDGERENKVWLNPQVVAEFNPGNAGMKAAIKADSGAKELSLKRPQAGIRLWKMSSAGKSALAGMVSSNPVGKYSPVFHDGPNSNSAMRSLPGNVIVIFVDSWSDSKVNAWLESHKVQAVKKLNIGNAYLIKSNPGMETLDLANALYLTGEVKAAYPDWWQEVVTK